MVESGDHLGVKNWIHVDYVQGKLAVCYNSSSAANNVIFKALLSDYHSEYIPLVLYYQMYHSIVIMLIPYTYTGMYNIGRYNVVLDYRLYLIHALISFILCVESKNFYGEHFIC